MSAESGSETGPVTPGPCTGEQRPQHSPYCANRSPSGQRGPAAGVYGLDYLKYLEGWQAVGSWLWLNHGRPAGSAGNSRCRDLGFALLWVS